MSKENFQLSGSPNRALLAATLGFFFGAMSISLFGPTAKALTDVMGLTPAEVGLLVAVPSLSGSLLRIPFGASVDVNGGRKSFNFLMLCSAIGLIGLSILFSTRFPENMNGLYPVILLLGCIKSDNRMLLIIRAHRSKQEPIKAQVYKLFRAKATLRVENTTEDTVELIYEITQKLLRRAEQTTPDIPGSIYSLGSIDYVNLVMQNDEVSN